MMNTVADMHFNSLVPMLPPLPERHRANWERFFDEAVSALHAVDASLLREWGRDSLSIAVRATMARGTAIRDLVVAVARGAWAEFKALFTALFKGEITDYLKDACRRAWNALRTLWDRVATGATEAAAFIRALPHASRSELVDHAAAFMGGVIGFVFMGGTGDSGLIDADISLLGIGGHRSLFFHSVLIGLAAEVCFLSLFRLIQLLHSRLPRNHAPLWDRLLNISGHFNEALVKGSWIGVATHLAIDSHIDGWTPYKDLPIVLPEWGHHLVMDVNAAAAGWFGWQWYRAKRILSVGRNRLYRNQRK